MSIEQDKYRREGGHLYELTEDGRAYVHCYQNPRLANASIDALITDYLYDEDTDDTMTQYS
jgi:hypothetical protein